MGQAIAGVAHLIAVGAALELLGHLVEHAAAGGADGVAEALEAARGVDGHLPFDVGQAVGNEPGGVLGVLHQPQVADVEQLGAGEAVVHLGQADLPSRVADARLLVGHASGGAGGREAQPVVAAQVEGLHRVDGQGVGLHQHIVVLVAGVQGHLGTGDDQGRRPVRDGAAVVAAQGPGDHGRREGLIQGDGAAEVGLGVGSAVLVVLHRHPRQVLLRPAPLVEGAGGGQGEESRSARPLEHGMVALLGQAAGALVEDLLHPADQHHVVDA